jgi:hypothetical protein
MLGLQQLHTLAQKRTVAELCRLSFVTISAKEKKNLRRT